ncbi:MAG: class I SAM-dependent methyltransferase [Planctomycetota bacterium]
MLPETGRSLNDVNRRFYTESAERFHATRSGVWRGWQRLLDASLPRLRERPDHAPLRVLDVGCGNGRFQELLPVEADYLGVDFSRPLLDQARALPGARCSRSFLELDLLAEPLESRLSGREFDLVVLLGILHHIPGFGCRQELLRGAGGLLARSGLLAVSFWDYARAKRIAALRVPWESLAAQGGPEIDRNDLEPGDDLLSFGADPGALRYCHFAELEERRRLMAAAGLTVLEEFRADGREGDLNHYFLATR